MAIVSVILAVVISLGVAFILHPLANKGVSALQGADNSTAADPAAASGSTTDTTLPAWSSDIVTAEHESESPTQVASDLSNLLAQAYETGPRVWAVDYLENVFNCRDTSCGYTESVSQIDTFHIMGRLPGGDIVHSTASSSGPDQVSGAIDIQTAYTTITGPFTAVWNPISKEWQVTTITWKGVPSS